MKYKVGDIVKVKDDLVVDVWDGEQEVVIDMLNYKGKYVTIARISGESIYEIKEDNGLWYWTDEMFEYESFSNFTDGIVSDADYEYQKVAKINPIALHYEDEGKQPYIKYVCPICQSLGVRLQLEKGESNCPTCNINLNWEE